jgi:hypothetical protein
VERLQTAVLAAGETLWLQVWRRQRLGGIHAVDAATRQVDYAVRNVRVLARAGLTLTRLPATPPPALASALRLFATAVHAVKDALAAELAFAAAAAVRCTAYWSTSCATAMCVSGMAR